MDTIKKRNDKWAYIVSKRIGLENDLVAAEAKYHKNCFSRFLRRLPSGKSKGRPRDSSIVLAMEDIFSYIENNDDSQFTFSELKSLVPDCLMDDKTLVTKLTEKYGSKISITTKTTGPSIVCFRGTEYDILCKAWYDKRTDNVEDERMRLLSMAADILQQNIRSEVCDTKYYPSSNTMFNDVNKNIPKSLESFIEKLLLKNKKGNLEPVRRKIIAVCHIIMSIIRPRSFSSPLLLGLSVHLHRQFASRYLLDILSSLGLCSSYQETLLYEAANVFHPQPTIRPPQDGCFIQYVADNADHNVATIDGFDTFHSMGIIRIITPYDRIFENNKMLRLQKNPTAEQMEAISKVPLKVFENRGKQGLENILVEKLKDEIPTMSMVRNADLLWFLGKWLNSSKTLGWNGCMECLTKNNMYSKSRITFLPFINQPASNYNTIYTTLLSVIQDGKSHGHDTCVITFDQPLYQKAREILSTLQGDPTFSNLVIRLGGFHLLMSFLGCIGYFMAGSGLREVVSIIYAPNSVEKILSGHAYSRAIRSHTLLHVALSQTIFNAMQFNDDEKDFWVDYLNDFEDASPSFEDVENFNVLKELKKRFDEKISEFKLKGPTAKLWIQYFEMITIAKEFIRAERMGNWEGHLAAVKKMLPYFHAAGHFLYAKSAHLYVQDMEKLEISMDPEVFQKFTKNYFTIKRTDKFFCGTWSDMVIEQSLMKDSKSKGGFTRGRTTRESVLSKFVLGLLTTSNIAEGLQQFCGLSYNTGEQHVDSRDSRVERDASDVQKLLQWFESHEPFPQIPQIMSIATGITGGEMINCYNAQELGFIAMEKKTGENFRDLKFKRSDRVLSLQAVNSSIKINKTTVPIDPLLLFQRISLMKKTDDELRYYLQFELAPFPMALFNEQGMRKTTKSSFYTNFTALNNIDCENFIYIIDGGFLLHRVVWHQNDSFNSICASYVDYIKKHFGSEAIIVFDGYNNMSNSVKAMEQLRRSSKSSAVDVNFDETMNVTMTQEKFLSNNNNKKRLISMLSNKLVADNFHVEHALDDADVLIVETAIEQCYTKRTVIVGEDIDLLVILTARAPDDREIFFLKPGKNRVERKIYSSGSFNHHGNCKDHILFLHAFSGCDTTSAFFQKGKSGALKLLKKRPDLQTGLQIFNQPCASQEDIFAVGLQICLAIYGARSQERSINEHRYLSFAQSLKKKYAANLSLLPPTESAAQQHLLRVYYQCQKWWGNDLNPKDWGWTLQDSMLQPQKTKQDPAPDTLLNLIFCNCVKGCGSKCSCRKFGLTCSPVCGKCHGQSCFNAKPILSSEMSENEDDEDIPNQETDSEFEDHRLSDDEELEEEVEVNIDDDEEDESEQEDPHC